MIVNKEVIEMTRQIRKYTNEFQQEAINLALKTGAVSKTAEELGVPAATLHKQPTPFSITPKPT